MKKFSTSLLAILFVFALVYTASAQKRMTIEDALAIKNVGGPQLSPDGKRIAYTISEWDKKENRRTTHLYLISTDGGNPIKLTNGEKGESAPQWSPDGKRIAFLADRSTGTTAGGGAQIWLIPADGGEAEKLTSEENGAQSFRWSPDGKQIAFVTRDTPKDKEARDKKKKDKFDTITVDGDLVYSHLWTINLESKEKKRLTEGEFSASSPQWSPDGKLIAYTASKSSSQESAWTDISEFSNSEVFVISASGSGNGGGAARKLTTNPGPDSNPQWSPDGKWIAYNSSESNWAAKSNVMVVSPKAIRPKT